VKRGDVVTVAGQGDFGKPRPAVVIQSDRLARVESVVVLPMTSHLSGESALRLPIQPEPGNGLRLPSEVMIEKVGTYRPERCGPVIGALHAATMAELGRRLAFVLGLDE
jgi:mRNA interferase MazF